MDLVGNFMSSLKFVKSVVLSLSVLATAANANLIVNGSFEQLDVNQLNVAADANYPVGTTPLPLNLAQIGTLGNGEEWGVFEQLPGWNTINTAGVEVQYNGTGSRNAADGSLYLELDTHFDMQTQNGSQSNGGITQTVSGLVVGELYDFSFAYMGRSAVDFSNDFSVVLGGVSGVTFLGVLRDFDWSSWGTQFIATATSMDVTFEALGAADGKGALIDNVSLNRVNTPIPEPGVLALMVFGLIGFSLRKKQR